MATPTQSDVDLEVFGQDLLFADDLQLGPDGDYLAVEGVAAVRQAVYQRLITRPGEYKLDPSYGVGAEDYVKRAMTTANLDELRRRVIDNLRQDERIDDVIEVVAEKVAGARPGLRVAVKVRVRGRSLSLEPFTFVREA